MVSEKNVSLREFLTGLKELEVIPHLRFRRSQSGDPDEHDWIFLVCTKSPRKGSHIGRTCICCIGNFRVTDYEYLKDSISTETYDVIKNLLLNFTYTDVEYKAIDN